MFWVIKILTTGMGETASDYLAHTIGPLVSVPLGFIAFVVALAVQLRSTSFNAAKYWTAVVMVSVFGTIVADALHVGLGIPYVVSSLFFAVVLFVVLRSWKRHEGTLSIHSINSKPRELFYWATVVTTFALGTAVGDLTAVTFGWGYFTSAVVFAVLFAIPLVADRKWGLNEAFGFWAAYIVTRPLGASIADWLGVSQARSGLGWGTGFVTLLWAAAIAGCVTVVSVTAKS